MDYEADCGCSYAEHAIEQSGAHITHCQLHASAVETARQRDQLLRAFDETIAEKDRCPSVYNSGYSDGWDAAATETAKQPDQLLTAAKIAVQRLRDSSTPNVARKVLEDAITAAQPETQELQP